MGLNVEKMKAIQAGLESGGGEGFLKQKDLKRNEDIRIMPPKANLDGSYFFKQIIWWFGKKKFISHKTFGKPCIIEEEVEKAMKLVDKDPEGEEELGRLLQGKEAPKMSEENLIPILHLDATFDGKRVKSVEVIGEKVKILVAGKSLLREINGEVTSRDAENGTEDGIADRVEGFNIMLTKTGTGLDTEYDAKIWRDSYEMDKVYYKDSLTPDLIELTKKEMKSDAELRAAIRTYLYGEAAPKADSARRKDDDDDSRGRKDDRRSSRDDDEDRGRGKKDDKDDDRGGRSRRDDDDDKGKKDEGRSSSRRRDEDEDEDRGGKKDEGKKAAAKKTATGGGKRSLAEDLDD